VAERATAASRYVPRLTIRFEVIIDQLHQRAGEVVVEAQSVIASSEKEREYLVALDGVEAQKSKGRGASMYRSGGGNGFCRAEPG
jgi:uncharacterized protein (DUF1778 family)